jgi:hypothetical protein
VHVVEIVEAPGSEREVADAEARFLLARALWQGGSAADRARARALATVAHARFVAAGAEWTARADTVAAWLRRAKPAR